MSTYSTETERTANELTCPVPRCDYTATSAQSIAAHVGHHENGWGDAVGDPKDLHQTATAADEYDSKRAAKVRAWLARNGVTTDKVRVYVHQGYGSVQIDPNGHLGEQWPTFRALVEETDGVRYNGRVNWCTDEFVEQLPDVPVGTQCFANGCDRDDTLAPAKKGDEVTVTLCRYHRKQYFGVSS